MSLFVWNNSSLDHSADLEPPTLFLNPQFEFETWESLLGLGDAFSNFTSLELQLPATHPGLLPCLFRATKINSVYQCFGGDNEEFAIVDTDHATTIGTYPPLYTIVFNDDGSMWGASYQDFVSFLAWIRIIGPITRVLFQQCLVLNNTVVKGGLRPERVEVAATIRY